MRRLSRGGALAGVLLAILVPLAGAAPPASRGAGARPALHVIPFPGTPDASTQSQIIFSALRPSDFAATPIVSGSSSGLHSGYLTTLPDSAGTAFVPAAPFSAGERVTVHALLTSARAGTASGAPGSTALSWSFTVASPPPKPPPPGAAGKAARTSSSVPVYRVFRSEPSLHPPPVHVSSAPAPGPDDIFASPRSQDLFGIRPKRHSTSQSGPMILDPRGRLVWFDNLGGPVALNLEVQRYRGRPVLTWWQGGTGFGSEDVIMDASYRPQAVLKAGWGYGTDLHDFQITPQGTALVDSVVTVRANLTSIGGPADGAVDDYVIQELDIPTGKVLWEWHALGHIPVSASYWPLYKGAYDAFHLNSFQQLPDHRLLVSSRTTWAVYEIDERTGRVIWTLGGKRSNFKMGPGTKFEWQHDAHLNGDGLLTLFDDGYALGGHQESSQSSAKELKVDTDTHSVSLVHVYRHSPPLLTSAEGSAQLLENHDVFVGWGNEPVFSQYSPSGRQIFSASFPLGVDSYRAYRFPWTGHPVTLPALAVSRGRHGAMWLYASWNGATEVRGWRVLGGSTSAGLRSLEVKPWTGFETAMPVRSSARYFAVEALTAQGQVLGRSEVVAAGG